ncbi:MAG TPA: hypothetical protein VF921_00100, partial [Vicinamibacterales bacterium]
MIVYAHGRVYVLNDLSSTVSAFAANPITGALTPLPFSPFPIGFGAWGSIAVHPSGSPVVVGNNSGNIASFVVTATSASPAAGSPYATPDTSSLSTTFSRNGNFLYAGPGPTRFAGFSVTPSTGVLAPLAGSPFESGISQPVAYAADADGRLFSASLTSAQVQAYTTSSGAPTAVAGGPFPSGSANVRHGLLHPSGFYITAGAGHIGVYHIAGSGSGTTLTAVTGSPFFGGTSDTAALALTPDGGLLVGANVDSRSLSVFRMHPVTGQLTTLGVQPADTMGTTGGINGVAYAPPPVTAGDFDGDGMSDITVYRPSTNNWHALKSTRGYGSYQSFVWGISTDKLTPGDYDGDGKVDPAVFAPSSGGWFMLNSSQGYSSTSVSWGLSTDIPVPGDYDGDGKTDPAIWRPSTGLWAILLSSTSYTTARYANWGLSTDLPMQGDFDGDGKTDPAIWRPSNGLWAYLLSSTDYATSASRSWGLSTDLPVPGDYDGDGKIDPAVFRASTRYWYILYSSTGYTTSGGVSWGLSTDVPVPSDFDGDGLCDPAVYRPSNGGWYVLRSS